MLPLIIKINYLNQIDSLKNKHIFVNTYRNEKIEWWQIEQTN